MFFGTVPHFVGVGVAKCETVFARLLPPNTYVNTNRSLVWETLIFGTGDWLLFWGLAFVYPK